MFLDEALKKNPNPFKRRFIPGMTSWKTASLFGQFVSLFAYEEPLCPGAPLLPEDCQPGQAF